MLGITTGVRYNGDVMLTTSGDTKPRRSLPLSMVPSLTVMCRYFKAVLMDSFIVQHSSRRQRDPPTSRYPIHFHDPEWQIRQRFVYGVATYFFCNRNSQTM